MKKSEADLFVLLRMGLWGNAETIENVDWSEVLSLADEQTVTGIVADAIALLPHGDGPAAALKTPVIVRVMSIERRNAIVNADVKRLFHRLIAMELQPVLMKGQAFAALYPHPSHRQSGDIDVWFPREGDCQKAVEWVRSVDKETAYKWDHKRITKDYSFRYRNTLAELHFTMEHFASMRLQKRFLEIADSEYNAGRPYYIDVEDERIETVPPTLAVLHQIVHVTRHLLEAGIGLRQLCDMAVYLHRHKEDIDGERLRGYLQELQLQRIAAAIGQILHEQLGLEKAFIPFATDGTDAEFILNEIFVGGNFGKKLIAGRDALPTLRRKWWSATYFLGRCRRYRRLIPREAAAYYAEKIQLNVKYLVLRHY